MKQLWLKLINWEHLIEAILLAYLVLGILGMFIWGFLKGFALALMPWTLIFQYKIFHGKTKKEKIIFGVLFTLSWVLIILA